MMVMPKKGYRVCLQCGKISLSKQLVDLKYGNKMHKCCPYCHFPEDMNSGTERINQYQANNLFMVAGMTTKEFIRTPESDKKYKQMYDAYSIPEDLRIY